MNWNTHGPSWRAPRWNEPEYMLTVLGDGGREFPYPCEDWWWIPMSPDCSHVCVLGKHNSGASGERRYDSMYPEYLMAWADVPQPVKDMILVRRAQEALSV